MRYLDVAGLALLTGAVASMFVQDVRLDPCYEDGSGTCITIALRHTPRPMKAHLRSEEGR